ncbi:unnamed protein product [Spirodela intermedia]|uniref:Phytocyanin domain-containing protein n=1 Tax=Spirodela intermedia TaxID=51605 RepID=A0A7I8JAN6_SPIIN|nr:unnamed protein product [Spirodela intermedia]CAA6667180.1 unnamed protein product [Spirodela intermedia]
MPHLRPRTSLLHPRRGLRRHGRARGHIRGRGQPDMEHPIQSQLLHRLGSRQTFAVGDSLVFNFNNGAHDVLEVTRANYDDCTTSNPIATYTTGPATVELTAAGTRYFICGVNGHCSAGQKMTLTVAAASTPSATPPSPTSSGAPTPPTTVASPPTSSTPGPSGSAPGVPGAAPSATLGTAAVAAPLR